MVGKYSAVVVALLLLVSSCKKKKTEEAEEDNFDRTAMLTNYADVLINPSLATFSAKSNVLYTNILLFTQKPSQGSLDSAQSALKEAATAYQYCSAFRFGPVVTQFGSLDDALKRVDYMNTYPVSTSVIENFINLNYTDLTDVDVPSRGLNAVDYLLNDLTDKDTAIINKFTASNSRKEFLKSLALDLKNRANNAYSGWQSFRSEFIGNNGTSSTSSTAELIKQFTIDFETLKNYEIGTPVGRIFTTSTLSPEPTKTQFYYGGYSTELTKEHFQSIENIWYGKEGIGLKEYLESVDTGQETAAATINQMNSIKAKLALMPKGRLSDLIQTNKEPVSSLYTEILKLTHFLKSDMPSKLGIYITYASGDGD